VQLHYRSCMLLPIKNCYNFLKKQFNDDGIMFKFLVNHHSLWHCVKFLSFSVNHRACVYARARRRGAWFRTQHVGRVTWQLHRTDARRHCDSVMPSCRPTQTTSTLVQRRQATSGTRRRLDHRAWWRQTTTWRPIHVSRDQPAGICQSDVHRSSCWYILLYSYLLTYLLTYFAGCSRFTVAVRNFVTKPRTSLLSDEKISHG